MTTPKTAEVSHGSQESTVQIDGFRGRLIGRPAERVTAETERGDFESGAAELAVQHQRFENAGAGYAIGVLACSFG